MSMTTDRTVSNRPSFGSYPYWGNRSRISWGAVLAGAVVAVATSILLSLLGAALGGGSINAFDATSTDIANYGAGVGIWEIINLALSMAFGGYVAARLSGTHSHLDGELHGVTTWGLAVLFGAFLLTHALSGLVSTVGSGAGAVITRAIGDAGAISSAVPPELNPQIMTDRLQQILGASGDPTTMTHEQIGAEIAALVRSRLLNGSLSDADRNRLVALVAAQSGVTSEEAARRVSQMENEVKATAARVEQKARAAADQVAHSATTAAQALFTGLVLSLLAALVGSWIGTRHKRQLHPADAFVPATQDTVYPARVAYEQVEPSSVSVYDDDDHLVYQYLGGISFPVTKQDLLRIARSRGDRGGLLNSIETMPDRRYTSANDVLKALGMTQH